jgi:YD repeat-containing protein
MRTEETVLTDGSKTVYTYNDAGLHVRTTDYDEDGNIYFDIHYEVDTLQRVIGWRVLDKNGNTLKRFEVDHDLEGLEIENRQYGGDDSLERREKYLYDDNGVLVETQHFDATGILGSREIYTPTHDGVSSQCYDALGNPIDSPAV